MNTFMAICLAVGSLCWAGFTTASAAEFSAVLYSTLPNGEVYPADTLTPNFWAKGDMYRYQGLFKERPMIIISNRITDTSLYCESDDRQCRYFVRSDRAVPDPIQMWNAYFAELKKEEVGTEKIRGYTCTKYKYTAANGLWAEQWVSDSLGYFLMLVMHYPGNTTVTVELVSITEEQVPEMLLQAPEGFELSEDILPDMSPPQPKVRQIDGK